MFLEIFLVDTIVFLLALFFSKSIGIRAFILCFYFSTIYYGILGPWYWIEYRSGWFLEVRWAHEINSGIWIYTAIMAWVFLCIVFLEHTSRSSKLIVVRDGCQYPSKSMFILTMIGIFSSLYVFLVGSSGDRDSLKGDAFALIFYQFSDLLIAVILFYASVSKNKIRIIIFVVLFILYAGFTGLRYKMALLLGAILIAAFIYGKVDLRKVLLSFFGGGIVVIFFAILTVTRNKFSGLDVDNLLAMDWDTFWYGLFAESNSIFGLMSALHNFGDRFEFVGIKPLLEVFEQYIPRFIYPDKNLYGHLKDVAYGISYTTTSELSGTSLPFFGEYYTMGGWPAVILGCSVYSYFSWWLIFWLSKSSAGRWQSVIGIGLAVVFMGYYCYSRGSVSQISKGIFFVVFPYCFLVSLQYKIFKFNSR
jgi:hypothetical protein